MLPIVSMSGWPRIAIHVSEADAADFGEVDAVGTTFANCAARYVHAIAMSSGPNWRQSEVCMESLANVIACCTIWFISFFMICDVLLELLLLPPLPASDGGFLYWICLLSVILRMRSTRGLYGWSMDSSNPIVCSMTRSSSNTRSFNFANSSPPVSSSPVDVADDDDGVSAGLAPLAACCMARVFSLWHSKITVSSFFRDSSVLAARTMQETATSKRSCSLKECFA
mmetsp:Transcript_27717/g.77653  ORF Transcript_27717/g.77653 Transcript_27717/m.77653 type:complete len:226 (+) Transcript_27717:269-946(+)